MIKTRPEHGCNLGALKGSKHDGQKFYSVEFLLEKYLVKGGLLF